MSKRNLSKNSTSSTSSTDSPPLKTVRMGPNDKPQDQGNRKVTLEDIFQQQVETNQKIDSLRNDLVGVNATLSHRINKVEDATERLEAELRKKNIVIRQMPDSEHETNAQLEKKLIDFFVKKMMMPEEIANCMIDVCFRMGKPNNNLGSQTRPYNRPILVKFIREKHRAMIFQHVKHLHKDDPKIEPDMTKSGKEKKNLLVKYRKEAKANNSTVKMVDAGLIVDGILHVVDKSMQVVPKN